MTGELEKRIDALIDNIRCECTEDCQHISTDAPYLKSTLKICILEDMKKEFPKFSSGDREFGVLRRDRERDEWFKKWCGKDNE